MKRRQLLRYAPTGVLAALATGLPSTWQTLSAQTPASSPSPNSLSVQWLGHTCFLFTGGGLRVLVNPFQSIGCTQGYRNPKVRTDLILISSRLLDEGSVDGFAGNPALLYEPGVYQFNGQQIQGIRTEKDRRGGKQFGVNVAWLWTQAGIKILHLGGLASPILAEQRILMGRPDLLLLPVGGGPKAYTPQEAKEALQILNPKIVIPTHYKTQAADPAACDIAPVEDFLGLVAGMTVRQINSDTVSLTSSNLPENGSVIEVLSYKF